MILPWRVSPRGARIYACGRLAASREGKSTIEESIMTWETPCAIDLRFGMEITMYISNR
jgi:coenzyme PQQ precursor peptide PqqA